MIIIYVHFRESRNEENQGRVCRKSKKDVDKGRNFILNMSLTSARTWCSGGPEGAGGEGGRRGDRDGEDM